MRASKVLKLVSAYGKLTAYNRRKAAESFVRNLKGAKWLRV